MGIFLKLLGALLGLLFLAEFGLRVNGYHLTVMYQREGNLLFAPRPNQQVTEKIALTPTRVNNYGVRGEDIDEEDLKQHMVVVCLGDSITYGYGVGDDGTYPYFIQKQLDEEAKERFLVVNAGVNAYPITLMRERYLNLLERGIEPEYVVIGYSMNEGLLGAIAEGDEALKVAFEKRIILKNALRSIGLYNLVVENWARIYYDRYKARFIPGTNQVQVTPASSGENGVSTPAISKSLSPEEFYQESLAKIGKVLKERGRVKRVIAVCSASHDAEDNTYNTNSPYQKLFKEAAKENGWVLVSSDDLLHRYVNGGPLDRFFIDRCHMSVEGNKHVGFDLAKIILENAGGVAQ
jgi:lysophospholipase L1-like esterase